ncbi:TonB-dependent receptor [uncultured Bacteroides sp.]|uniref:SusC/RagA family TonB-linked outer membrane protein n=1 Tax=uncultured Bacteroides sp. TaxID=162156 RepID=UPI002AA7C420|nr:TonB-dependent receptor [uncultured Bacteroides sp.]
MLCQLTYAQKKAVSGLVRDTKGEVVIGASVLEEGTTNGTITDLDGNFKLNVSPKAVLKISYIGYKTQEVPVNGKSLFNIILAEDAETLEEVVVVGYGAQKKESVVGAISQVSSKELMRSPSGNISQALAGKMPGVITSQTSGAPGSDDAKIYIRGQASFAGDNQPLILVDGVERAYSQISPDDIESISTLKDASATAVYGVRGANGVMLITTKRGKDQKPTVSLSANFQVQSPTRRDTYLNSYQSVSLLEEALANDGLPSQFSPSDLEMYKKSSEGQLSGIDAMLYPNVDWYDYVLRKNAPAQRYNINVQGGTKRMRYFVSGEYYNQQGLFKNFSTDQYGNASNSSYRRYAFRANLDFLLTKDLTASLNFGTRFEERRGPNSNEYNANYSEVFYELNHTPGWLFPVAYEVGEGEDKQIRYGGNSQNQNNIVGRLAKAGFYRATNTINETNFIVNYKMDWLTQGLSAKAMLSFDYDSYYRRLFTADFATYELLSYDNGNYDFAQYNTDTELAYDGNTQTTTMKLYMEYALNYARKFGKHDVGGLLLYNQNDYRYQADLAQRYQGLVGRVTYGYDERYLAEVNFGYNGSENFIKGKRFGFFPSFSVGWRISNEEFMKSTQKWLNNLKIRASYGEVGNDKYYINGVLQRFLYQPVWTQLNNSYTFGSSSSTGGIYESQYPNYTVTWERARKYNLGIDAGLWNGLLSANIDFFMERRKDILTPYLTRPQWVGVNMASGNLGETKNAGYEIELKHNYHIGKDFQYNVGLTVSHAKNKILSEDEPEAKTDYRKREGHPINQYFGLICDGFVTSADLASPDFPVSTFGNVQVGDLKYRDMNKDGFIDDRDETSIGYSDIPENTYALTLGCEWKGIGFNVMLQGVDHVSRYYDAEAMYAFVNGGKVKEHHLKRWNPALSEAENLKSATYPLLHYDNYGNHNQRQNSFFLQNGAFLRVKNIELSYSIPQRIVKKWSMNDFRLYINASNLITWDHLNNLTDPESNGSNRYPIMKTVNFGVNVKF